METLVGKALNDLAALVSEKWYAGMGLVGLIIFMWVLLKGSAQDDILVASIGLTMMGFGFAEAESCTFRQFINMHYKVTAPARKYNFITFLLYTLGTISAGTALARAYVLIW